jgi:hypothetical protein
VILSDFILSIDISWVDFDFKSNLKSLLVLYVIAKGCNKGKTSGPYKNSFVPICFYLFVCDIVLILPLITVRHAFVNEITLFSLILSAKTGSKAIFNSTET